MTKARQLREGGIYLGLWFHRERSQWQGRPAAGSWRRELEAHLFNHEHHRSKVEVG